MAASLESGEQQLYIARFPFRYREAWDLIVIPEKHIKYMLTEPRALTLEEAKNLKSEFPRHQLTDLPWHLIRDWWPVENSEEEMDDAPAEDVIRRLPEIRHRCSADYQPNQPPNLGKYKCAEFMLEAMQIRRCLEEAFRYDYYEPQPERTRLEELNNKWGASANHIHGLKDAALRELCKGGRMPACYAEVSHLAQQLYMEVERHKEAARELSVWLKSGQWRRWQDEDEPIALKDDKELWFLRNQFSKNLCEVEDWLSVPTSDSDCRDIMPPFEITVTVRQITIAVGGGETAVRDQTPKWGKPHRPDRKRGGGAQWLIEDIWPQLEEKYKDDDFAMPRLELLRKGIPLESI